MEAIHSATGAKQSFKTLQLIHLAFLMGQVMFLSVVFLKGQLSPSEPNKELSETFQLVVPLLALGGLIAGIFLFKQNLKGAKKQNQLSDKLKRYTSASLIKFALLEGPCLFSIVAYLLTNDLFFVGASSLIILIFLLERPTIGKIVKDLGLTSEEKNELE